MENNIYNAIVQGEQQDAIAPGAELNETPENKQNQENDGAFISNNASLNYEKAPDSHESDNENPSAAEIDVLSGEDSNNSKDAEIQNDTLTDISEVQIDMGDVVSDVQNDIGTVGSDVDNHTDLKKETSHISVSIEEAMRKIMNFTAEVKDMDKNDDDSDKEKTEDKEMPSLEHSDNTSFSSTDDTDISITSEVENDNYTTSTSDVSHEHIRGIENKAEGEKVDIAKDGASLYDETHDSDIADDDDDDGYILEDEFSNIPESFFDEDIDDADDDSSLSSLLYDDDDAEATSDFEMSDSVSFTQLKQEMQKIKDEAMELRTVDVPEETDSEDITTDESEEVEASNTTDTAGDEVIEDTPLESNDTTEVAKVSQERKSYIRDTEEEKDISTSEEIKKVKEQVITIDRERVREKSVPEGRLIDTIFEAVEIFTFSVLFIMLILSFIFRYSKVSGESMYPTFNDGDRLIVSKLLYTPKRGDIVVFDDRSNEVYEDEAIIKRIIALEGDTVKIENKTIYVMERGNDEFVIVNYVDGMDMPNYDMQPVVVPEGEMFVMGDNVNNSKDSREVGTIKVESIIGKVILRFYTTDAYYSEELQEVVNAGRIVFDTKF